MKNPHSGTGEQLRAIWGWCLYDFANSPFTTLIISFIYASYFTQSVGEEGTVLWSRAVTFSAILVALLSPILGTLADQGGWRKRFLAVNTVLMIVSTAGLAWVDLPSQAMTALGLFILANVAYELGFVFYNAFLPTIASPQQMGRISGYGWGLGYMGGLSALFICLFLIPQLGISIQSTAFIHAVIGLTAGWMALFSIPIFLWVPEEKKPFPRSVLRGSFQQLWHTFQDIRQYQSIVRLLAARLFYNDGLITIFAFAGIYAGNEFGLSTGDLIAFGIAVNIASGLGAVVMGYMDDRVGGKNAILISLGGLFIATLLAAMAWEVWIIWVTGVLAGLFAGPNQAASRSLLGKMIPPGKETEFYGFFAFSGKMTAFLGPLCYGIMTQAFGTERAGVAFVLLFFILGAWILCSVKEPAACACPTTPIFK